MRRNADCCTHAAGTHRAPQLRIDGMSGGCGRRWHVRGADSGSMQRQLSAASSACRGPTPRSVPKGAPRLGLTTARQSAAQGERRPGGGPGAARCAARRGRDGRGFAVDRPDRRTHMETAFGRETSQPSTLASTIAAALISRPKTEVKAAMTIRLHLAHLDDLDQLLALEYGRVDEGQPEDWWRLVGDCRRLPARGRRGRERSASRSGTAPSGPRRTRTSRDLVEDHVFDVPMLGLLGASAGEIILGSRAFFAGSSIDLLRSVHPGDRELPGEEAVAAWQCCLEAGERAPPTWGLGTALLRLGRHREAYRHLRYYTRVAPELTFHMVRLRAGGRRARAGGRGRRHRCPPGRRAGGQRRPGQRGSGAARSPRRGTPRRARWRRRR